MTVRINKQKINLREKLAEFEDKVNFDEVVRGLGEYTGNIGVGATNPEYGKLVVQGDYSNRSSNCGLEINVADSYGVSLEAIERRIEGGNVGHKFSITAESIFLNSNVGIGTASPTALLSVMGPNALGTFFNAQNYGAAGVEFKRVNTNSYPYNHFIFNNGDVGIGTTNPGTYKLNVNGTTFCTAGVWGGSDDRIKHNEQPIVGALETLSKLTPKKYIKTTEMYEADHDFELDEDGNPVDANGQPVEHTIEAGVIAQQVLEVPELVFMVSPEGVDEDGNVTSPHGLNYNSLFTYAIAAIQEQQSIIEDLKSRIETLESK